MRVNELYAFVFSNLTKTSSFDKGRIVATKKILEEEKDRLLFFFITNTY
jgi:hypothetical protein